MTKLSITPDSAMQIRIAELPHCHTLPTKGSEWAAAWDLYAAGPAHTYTIFSYRTELVPTGVSIEIPNHFCGLILPRSGLATKRLIVPTNSPGLIDPDYRGELMVGLTLHSSAQAESCEVQVGDRIAQLLILPYVNADLTLAQSLTSTGRGDAGFGSTDK